jgi:hypothetical protein
MTRQVRPYAVRLYAHFRDHGPLDLKILVSAVQSRPCPPFLPGSCSSPKCFRDRRVPILCPSGAHSGARRLIQGEVLASWEEDGRWAKSPLAQVDAVTLQTLIVNAVQESRQLDYKETLQLSVHDLADCAAGMPGFAPRGGTVRLSPAASAWGTVLAIRGAICNTTSCSLKRVPRKRHGRGDLATASARRHSCR